MRWLRWWTWEELAQAALVLYLFWFVTEVTRELHHRHVVKPSADWLTALARAARAMRLYQLHRPRATVLMLEPARMPWTGRELRVSDTLTFDAAESHRLMYGRRDSRPPTP